ncbi:MAG: hypothetical protein WD467_00355 [Candidatus Saccharimonadales bacterium]
MATTSKNAAKKSLRFENNTDLLLYGLIFILWYAYLFMTLATPIDVPYDLSNNIVLTLRITIAAPFLAIWFSGIYAYIRTIAYSHALRGWAGEIAFKRIAYGILFLLSGAIIPSLLSTSSNYFSLDGGSEIIVTVLINYFRVVPYLIAFLLFFDGVRRLSRAENIFIPVKRAVVTLAPLLILAFVWLEIIFSNPLRTDGIYHLRDSLIILTLVLPSLTAWALGGLAALSFHNYAAKVSGTIYAKALKFFVVGLVAVVFSSIMLQSFTSLGTERLLELRIRELLLIIYIFLGLQGSGYFFMARGAKKLTKIEVV